ncbi:MAG: hypothetical protein AB8B72_14340 [Crocinitomicaceae bacterium]
MKVLYFLFLIILGFTIFEFIWGVFKFLFNLLTRSLNSPIKTNSVRILKYILFTAVAIQYVKTVNSDPVYIGNQYAAIALSAILLLLYLFGKYQTRASISQISGMANQFVKGFMSAFDPKLELTLIIGSVAFFVLGGLYPDIVNNGITNWFVGSIVGVYDTFFFGFIFMIISGFILVNTLTSGAKIVGRLLSGQSFVEATKRNNPFAGRFSQGGFGGNPFQNRNQNQSSIPQEPEFTEYEEVKDEEN